MPTKKQSRQRWLILAVTAGSVGLVVAALWAGGWAGFLKLQSSSYFPVPPARGKIDPTYVANGQRQNLFQNGENVIVAQVRFSDGRTAEASTTITIPNVNDIPTPTPRHERPTPELFFTVNGQSTESVRAPVGSTLIVSWECKYADEGLVYDPNSPVRETGLRRTASIPAFVGGRLIAVCNNYESGGYVTKTIKIITYDASPPKFYLLSNYPSYPTQGFVPDGTTPLRLFYSTPHLSGKAYENCQAQGPGGWTGTKHVVPDQQSQVIGPIIMIKNVFTLTCTNEYGTTTEKVEVTGVTPR